MRDAGLREVLRKVVMSIWVCALSLVLKVKRGGSLNGKRRPAAGEKPTLEGGFVVECRGGGLLRGRVGATVGEAGGQCLRLFSRELTFRDSLKLFRALWGLDNYGVSVELSSASLVKITGVSWVELREEAALTAWPADCGGVRKWRRAVIRTWNGDPGASLKRRIYWMDYEIAGDALKTKPVNTSNQDPRVHLMDAMVQGSGRSIEAAEARGQEELVQSESIPSMSMEMEEKLKELGFELGEIDASDPWFRHCKLPRGWKREGSGHSMWSYIVDERGFRRISIFYKAAFYDRDAFMSLDDKPCTAAQNEYYEKAREAIGDYPQWMIKRTQDGDISVYTATEQVVEDGREVYDHEAGEFKTTGRIVVHRVDMEGNLISTQEEGPAH